MFRTDKPFKKYTKRSLESQGFMFYSPSLHSLYLYKNVLTLFSLDNATA